MDVGFRAPRAGAPSARAFGLKAAIVALGATAVAACFAAPAQAETRAQPFEAWPKAEIIKTMSLDEARAFVAARTGPQTEWLGPADGPQATKDAITVVYVSADQSYVSFVNWGRGVTEAAEALGWQAVTLNGKGTVTGTLSAMQQAVSMNPAAIVTSADASALQAPIRQAVAAGIPVIGIHSSAFPGPDPEANLFMNVTSDPAEIGAAQAAYVIAESNGKARQIHFLDNSFAIARLKAEAATEPVKNCEGCEFLEMINIPIADQTKRIPSVISGVIANYGEDWWGTTCCDNFFPYVASALRASGVDPSKVRLVGADGPPSAYDMIRKGEYEVATVPEPSTLFGYQAVDAVVRAMAGQEPAKYVQPVFIVTRDNVDKEGGDKNEFIPSNNFACHYMNIWRKAGNSC